MGKTSIEWCSHTVNPIRARNLETGAVGHFCEKVSPGCKHCYASAWNERVRPIAGKNGGHLIGTGLAFVAENREKVEFFLDESKFKEVFALERKAAAGETVRLFWCDMTDVFGAWVPDAWIDRVLAVCALTPHVTHILVTKRATRAREYFGFQFRRANLNELVSRSIGRRAHFKSIERWPLPNVWLLVSAERQEEADERIPELLATPVAVRGVSLEPLLGPIDLGSYMYESIVPRPPLDWLVIGGESHPRKHLARPMDVAWFRSLVKQGQAAGVAVFGKQWGSKPIETWNDVERHDVPLRDHKGGDITEWPSDLQLRQFPASSTTNLSASTTATATATSGRSR